MRTGKSARATGLIALTTGPALAMTGCGASGGSSTSADGRTTVKMIIQPGPEGDAMQELVKSYNSGQGKKDGIDVDVVPLSRGDTFGKEATLMSTKSADYDIYYTASYLIAQHKPYLEPIDLDESNYFDVAADALKVDGEQYGLPLDPSVHELYYREDLISDMLDDADTYGEISKDVLGETLEPKEPDEWDWDDYIASAAYFTKKYNDDSPTKYGTQLQAKNLVFNAMVWDDLLWSFGGSWLTDDDEPDLTSDAAQQAMEVYRTIYTKGLTSPDSGQAEFPETQAALSSGNAAFAVQWVAGYNELNDKEKSPKTAGKIGIAPVPGNQSHAHFLAIGVNKYGDHVDESKKFFEWLDAPDVMSDYLEAGGIASMPDVLDEEDNPNMVALTDTLENGSFTEPALPRTFDIQTALAKDLSGAWVGNESISKALKKANSDLEKLASE